MATGRSRKAIEAPAKPPESIIASAARVGVADAGWNHYRFTDEGWQIEAWRHYDLNEQLHNSAEYVGSACSLIRLYIAEVDENGRVQDEITDDNEIASIVDTLFGGPASKAEILRNIAISLTVAGECYLIGKAGTGRAADQWMVSAPSEVKRTSNNEYKINVGNGIPISLKPGRDVIIRVWTPHPRKSRLSDSPVRAALPLLYEMEQFRGFLNAQLNSRIANAVILPVPSTLSTPRGDSTAATSDDVYQQIYEVVTSNLAGKGTAAQVAPVLWPMPLEELQAMAGIEPIRFDSPLSEQMINLRQEARMRLATGMNVPIDIQLGARDSSHWSIWWSGEEFILKTVAPLMNRIVEAITLAWLIPALKKLGKNPDRYTFAYDTAPLANSANKLADTLNLYQQGLVSGEEVRRQGGYTPAAAPSSEEEQKRFVKEVILRDPSTFGTPKIREAAGVEIDTEVPDMATPPPPPPPPEREISGPKPGQLPQKPAATDAAVDDTTALSASARPGPSLVQVAANAAVLRALELSGKRLLTPAVRGKFPNTPATKLHTMLDLKSKSLDTLLAGAWDYLPQCLDGVDADPAKIRHILDAYVRTLLARSIEHNPSLLAAALDQAGVR